MSPTIWPKVKILFDGSEIRRSPVDMEKVPSSTGFYRYQVVVWDFFHQQYVKLVKIVKGYNPLNPLLTSNRTSKSSIIKNPC